MGLVAGTHLGPYEILERLGAGGMGEVYCAKDPRLGRDVAIKVLPEHLASDKIALKRFEREARAVAALSHPNILTIFDVGEDQGIYYAVTELLHGETLRELIIRSAISYNKSLDIAVSIAEGLAAAHLNGVIHRDLKPENIFITKEERVKILDFGLARLNPIFSSKDLTEAPTKSIETEAGAIQGTLPYMSPEQLRGESIDARTDIFSFGCVLYEMLSQHRPFTGQTPVDIITAVLKEEPAELRTMPGEIQSFIKHCLEKDREKRFQSSQDLVFALKAISSPSTISPGLHQGGNRIIRSVSGIALAFLILFISMYFWQKPSSKVARPRNIHSIAVLPFINVAADPKTEYLCDGLTETIINSLSQVPQLRVMARGTVFKYKGKQSDPGKAGRELNVDAVVAGSIQQQGENLIIQADFVNTADGSQIWGDQYNRKFSDILGMQSDISKQISEKLLLKISGEELKRVTKNYTENTEAYQYYLKGRYLSNKRTEESLKQAIENYQQAIDKDPAYALAYSGLSDAYTLLATYGSLPREDVLARAKAAAIKALQMDDDLAETHASMGAWAQFELNWSEAEKEFRRAIELNPNYATAHLWLAVELARLGRHDEGLAEIRRAQQLDPLSTVINGNIVGFLLSADRYDEAIKEGEKAIRLEPDNIWAHNYLSWTYEKKGMRNEAVVEYLKAEAITPEQFSELKSVFEKEGWKSFWKAQLEFAKKEPQHFGGAYELAQIHARIGETEAAFQLLEKAYIEKDPNLQNLRFDPLFDNVHSDPRFDDMLRRMKLI